MKFFGLVLLALSAATAISAQGTKGGVARPTYALLSGGRARAPVAAVKGRQVQQVYEEVPEEEKAALLSTRRQRPTPAPAPAPIPAPAPAPIIRQPAPAPVIRPAPRPIPARAALAAPVRSAPVRSAPVVEEAHPAPEPYSFSYAVKDEESGVNLSREESQDAAGNIVGFYHMLDAEGRVRRVDYTAGPEGFKANIQSNEEGLVTGESADARFNIDSSRTIRQQ
jgi:hypothetical protein